MQKTDKHWEHVQNRRVQIRDRLTNNFRLDEIP